jgi:twitching motility protein PilI
MAKRISLREFQQSLSERLVSAKRGDAGQALLGIESGTADTPGGERWLVDLTDSGEVVPLTALTSVPLTHDWFSGIANIRGALYSVVDFSAWRGGPPTPRNAEARLLLIGARHSINAALLVRRALGLRPRAQMTAVDATSEVGDGDTAAWFGGRYADASGATWTQLRIPALLTTPDYLDIAR